MEKEISIHNLIAEASVSAIRELASKGESLSVPGIALILAENPEIRKITASPKTEKKELPESSSKEIDNVKAELARVQTQKMDLLRHLREVEESITDQDKFFRRGMSFFIDLAKNQSQAFFLAELDDFRETLKPESPFENVEKSFSALRDSFLRHSPEKTEQPKEKSSFFDKWLKKTPQQEIRSEISDIESYREAHRDLLNELRLSLGHEYLEKFRDISRHIEKVSSIADMGIIRAETIAIIRDYISRISTEREDAASFIREIGSRLTDIEKHMIGSVLDTRKAYTENTSFNTVIGNHIADMTFGIDSCKTLEELKKAVVSKIAVIKEAIENKSSSDDQIRFETEKKLSYLKSGIDQMKHEIDSANTKAKALEVELLKDSLTGAFNRRAYERKILSEFQRFKRYKNVYSVLVFDVDLFKNINDRFGHMVGDRCLQEIIRRVKPVLRESDIVARYGGEEFVVILPETPVDGAMEAAEKIRKTVEATEFLHKEEQVKITISVGASQAVEQDTDPADVFARADEAMYTAKKNGRNRVSSR